MKHAYQYNLVNGHLIVKCEQGSYLIDTGAPSSVSENGMLAFAGREYAVQTDYMGVNPRSISDHIGTQITALIGVDILNDFNMVIDPRTSQIRLSDEDLHITGIELLLDSYMGIPIVEAEVNDKIIRLFFDTGARLSYLDQGITRDYPSLGITDDFYPGLGQFQTDIYSIPISLGTERIQMTVGNLPELLQITLMMANTSGILGSTVLSEFVVGLSLQKQKLILERITVGSLQQTDKDDDMHFAGVQDVGHNSITEGNAFTALCELAAKENWCWKIVCMCRHMYFRYAFREIVDGKHPRLPGWWSGRKHQHELYRPPFPQRLSIGDQRTLVSVLEEAHLKDIANAAQFPDWLGYLGLALFHSEGIERRNRSLTKSWIPRLLEMLPSYAFSRSHLQEILDDPDRVLTWQHLEEVESDLIGTERK